MFRPSVKSVLAPLSGLCLASLLIAADPNSAPAPAKKPTKEQKEQSKWLFTILPKSFQKNPLLAMTVITEMTDEGRKMKVPSAENPTYYYLVSAGFHEEGHPPDESKRVSQTVIEKQMKHALAASNYLEGDKEHAPTLVFVYVWGVHGKLRGPSEVGEDDGFIDVGNRNLLSRAAIVGGNTFAHELEKALNEQSTANGILKGSISDPVYRFTNRDDRTRELMEQTLDDCYFVVISAYEGASIARGEKKLLWRTKMSTAAQGVSMEETTPALIASGGAYFGEEMKESALVSKRIVRGGHVELGAPKVEEMTDKPISEMSKETPDAPDTNKTPPKE